MNEYMRAITLRSLRFSPSLNAEYWHKLVYYATEADSVVERLMASETWLFRRLESKKIIEEKHLTSVKEALYKTSPKPTARLRKNYILILGFYEQIDLEDNNFEDSDFIIKDCVEILRQGRLEELFQDVEPKIIRDKYYSNKRREDVDDPYPS